MIRGRQNSNARLQVVENGTACWVWRNALLVRPLDAGDHLLDHIGPDARLHGRFGTVHWTSRERRRLADDETILDALDEVGFPRSWVMGVDPEQLETSCSLSPSPGNARCTRSINRCTCRRPRSRSGRSSPGSGGSEIRLGDLATDEGERLRDDVREIEVRLETVLAAG
jgi:hypothetical protein